MDATQYFVVMPDGQKYGPADVATLSQWAVDQRLAPHSTLENATTGEKLAASSVPGIQFGPPTAPAAPSMPTANYPRPNDAQYGAPQPTYPAYTGHANSSDDDKSWLWGLLCGIGAVVLVLWIGIGGLILGIPAFRFGLAAWNNGQRGKGLFGMILGAIAIALWLLGIVLSRMDI
ncbi:MAG: hypothetical protein SFX74_08490 [Fimbriimonadaceae bacterium]|nr:hypothetical protein [Fimbriimonadaceae bacterium]